MDIKNYTHDLYQYLKALGDENRAQAQSQYMRNLFPYFGIMKTEQEKYWREFQSENSSIYKENAIQFCQECMTYPEREMWYIGLGILVKYKKHLTPNDLPFVQNLIVSAAWWDIVDMTASHLVGSICKNHPETKSEVNSWIMNENMWLRRVAIIYQLTYRRETDEEILYDHILKTCHESEFFIRKAIGWSLREYSKHNPESVRDFIDTHRELLSGLSLREGSKYLK